MRHHIMSKKQTNLSASHDSAILTIYTNLKHNTKWYMYSTHFIYSTLQSHSCRFIGEHISGSFIYRSATKNCHSDTRVWSTATGDRISEHWLPAKGKQTLQTADISQGHIRGQHYTRPLTETDLPLIAFRETQYWAQQWFHVFHYNNKCFSIIFYNVPLWKKILYILKLNSSRALKSQHMLDVILML